MLSLATALQIYGIAIAVSMLVAVKIKVLVVLTSRTKPVAKTIAAPQKNAVPVTAGIPAGVVAAISAAVSIITGQHHICVSPKANAPGQMKAVSPSILISQDTNRQG